jgi:hypothetical protein
MSLNIGRITPLSLILPSKTSYAPIAEGNPTVILIAVNPFFCPISIKLLFLLIVF